MFLAILKMMESSRAAVVTPTTSSNEWLKHVGISYLPYRACAILGIPTRGEARVEVPCFGITRGFYPTKCNRNRNRPGQE
jgi:hypothetical protein